MHSPENEQKTLSQAMKLVHQLSAKSQETLMQQLKLEELRREIQVGIDQADRGELIPAEEVLTRLRKRAEKRVKGKPNK